MYTDDTFPLFFFRAFHHTCCFFYHAPTILWILFYVEYCAVSIRLDEPKRSLVCIAFWLSLLIDQLIRYFRVTSTISLGFGRFIEQADISAALFLLSSPLHMQSLLPCLDTIVLRVVSKEERDRVFSLFSAWVSYTSHQPRNQKLPETRPPSPTTGASSDPRYPTLAHQTVQFARHLNEVRPRPSTRLLAVGAYPTGSDTEESELPTAAIQQGADMRTQPAQRADSEDELSDELPPNVEWALDEDTGEIVPRFQNEETAQMQEQANAEGEVQARPTSPILCDHEPTSTRCLTNQEATASDAGFNRQGQVVSADTNLSSVKITCPHCHFVLENISLGRLGSDNNAQENNMSHLTTDDTSMRADDVFGLPEALRGYIDLSYAGDEIMDNSLVASVNGWIEQISGVAGPGLSGSALSRDGMGSSASSTSDIEMGGVENPPETMQDRPLEPQPSLYSWGTPGRLVTDGLPASFNLSAGSNHFSPTPSTLRVDTSANIGPHSSAFPGTPSAQVGLAYSEGAAEALPSDVSMTSPAEATPSRGAITLRSVPREVTLLAGATLPSLKRSRSEDDHFMREAESPLGGKRCRRQSPERNSATVNSRQGGQGRLLSAARSLTRRRHLLRDLQSRRDPTTAGVGPGSSSNIQEENDIVMQADNMQEDIGVPDSPLSDLERYTSPVLAAAETNPLPGAEMQVSVQQESEVDGRPGDNIQSDVTRVLAETDSGSVLNMRADTGATLQEDIGVQGSPLSDLESYTSPVLAAVQTDFTEAEVAVEVNMQEDADTQREPIRDIQSDVVRLLAEIDSDYVLNMPEDTGYEIREDEGAMSDPLYDLQGSLRPALAEIGTISLPDTQMETNKFIQEELVVDRGMANWEVDNTNTAQGTAALDKGKGKAVISLEAEPDSDVAAEVDLGELARQTDPKEWRRLTKGGIPRASPARRMGAMKPVRASPRPIDTLSSMFTQGPPAAPSSTAAAATLSNSTAVAAPEPMERLLSTRQTSSGSKASSSSRVRKPGIWGKLKDAVKERKPSMQQKRREAERAATESAVESPSEANDNAGNVDGRSPGSSSDLKNKEN